MIRPREIRIALIGALLFIVGGMLQACASDRLLAPEPETQVQVLSTDEAAEPTCVLVNGRLVCKD